jgi:hypothetical protein
MPEPDQQIPPDEWLAPNETDRAGADGGPVEPEPDSFDDVPLEEVVTDANAAPSPDNGNSVAQSNIHRAYQIGRSLEPDDRLKLIARLWNTLPADHRAAFCALPLEDSRQTEESRDLFDNLPASSVQPIWPTVHRVLFDPTTTSGLYAVPRRFDLATIFVVTAAFSLFFTGLTLIGAIPGIKLILGGVLVVVAAAQALLLKVANPRGVSIVAGAVAYTLFSWIAWSINRYAFFINSFLFVTVINGVVLGTFLGYLAGVLVGGVFLVADILRGKFEGRVPASSDNPNTEGTN